MFMKNSSKVKQYVFDGLKAYKQHGGQHLEKMNPRIAANAAVQLADSSKYDLRELLSKHPNWDENLQAVVLTGTRIPVMDNTKVYNTVVAALAPVTDNPFNCSPKLTFLEAEIIAEWVVSGLDAAADRIEKFAADKFPGAFNRSAKRNRVLRKILVALGCWDDRAGSECQRKYAFISDSLSAKKTDFKLFLSINPAHIISMSNPKHDDRGVMLTSCHSLDNADYGCSAGCTGYAADDISMIAFTTKGNKSDAESCCTRKTSRQMMFYRPGSGILLQSRLYDTEGGTQGRSECGDLYRKMVQDAIAECEGCTNIWRTMPYLHQKDGCNIYFGTGAGFGGYADWDYSDFAPMLSIVSGAETVANFYVGTSGFCLSCGEREEGEFGIYCSHCKYKHKCFECGDDLDSGRFYIVVDVYGTERLVCRDCRDEHYLRCGECGEWYRKEYMYQTGYDSWECEGCKEYDEETGARFVCPDCGKLYDVADMVKYAGGYTCVDCFNS